MKIPVKTGSGRLFCRIVNLHRFCRYYKYRTGFFMFFRQKNGPLNTWEVFRRTAGCSADQPLTVRNR